MRAFADSRQRVAVEYRRFVAEGMGVPSPWCDLMNQVYSGSERFVERMQAMIDPARSPNEIPKRQRRPVAKSLDYYSAHYRGRDRAIAETYRSGAYSMQVIAESFDVSRTTASRATKRDEAERASRDAQEFLDRILP